MRDVASIGLVCFVAGLAGLAGVFLGAAIVWWLAARHSHSLLEQQRTAHHTTRKLLVQWQTQLQRGLAAFQATQTALLDEFLKSQSTARVGVPSPAVSTPSSPSSAFSAEPVTPRVPIEAEEPALHELSDAEIDALPPDLPVPRPSRRRVLPAPKSPVMRHL